MSTKELQRSPAEFRDIDCTPVSTWELRAWYLFGGTVEPISFSFAFFVPLIVESLGAGAAFETSDHSVPCNTSVPGYTCVIPISGSWVDPSAFYFYCVTLATFAQLVLFVGMGAIADHGGFRKKLMLAFSVAGAVSCLLFGATVNQQAYAFAGFLAVTGLICVGVTFVFVYAYLPPIARNHPDFLAHMNNPESTRRELLAQLDFITNKISSTAFVWMYGGSIVALLVSVALTFVVVVPPSFPQLYPFHIALSVFALIWLAGCTVVYKYLRERPGPPLPQHQNLVVYSFKKVIASVSHGQKLRNLFLFLSGWFFYSDSLGTLISVSVLWAQTQLGFTTTEVLILAAEVQFTALIGSYAWNQLQRLAQISSKRMVLLQNLIYVLIPAWGLLAFVPTLSFGFKQKEELFIAAAVHGLLLGGTQSTCRSLFSQLVPAGEESQFFSLYEITDKGSSWVGPFVVAAIDNSGADRSFVFLFLFVQFLVSLALFSLVDVEKGVQEGNLFGGSAEQEFDDWNTVSP